jgi:CDP-diacylglycerol pyrophosphatase
MTPRRPMATLLILLAIALVPLSIAAASDPDALRKIVEGRCVPNESATSNPKPCRLVDLQCQFASNRAPLFASNRDPSEGAGLDLSM